MVDTMTAERARLGLEPLPSNVEQALRFVPRDVFLPHLALHEAYNPAQAVVTSTDVDGIALSSVSAPNIVATMLTRADLQPGHRVLEIGSGGYNAALLRQLVGPTGQVTSVDIDAAVIDRATRCLGEAGYTDVQLAVADGTQGFPAHAPFDRIIVTAGVWDLPPHWDEQLVPDGRLVVPMRIRGLTRCLTLQRAAQGFWQALAVDMCGFVRMRGHEEHWERFLQLNENPQVALRLEDGPPAQAVALRQAVPQRHEPVWSGVLVGAEEPTDSQDLFLATVSDRWAQLLAHREAITAGLIAPIPRIGTPALINTNGTGFAYRTLRRSPNKEQTWEFGAVGHGPQAQATAEQMCALLADWDHTVRRQHLSPHVTLHAADTPRTQLPPGSRVVDKHRTRLALTWSTSVEEGSSQ